MEEWEEKRGVKERGSETVQGSGRDRLGKGGKWKERGEGGGEELKTWGGMQGER